MRTLVRNALRMRADRIIVGEVRGAEVFDMLQAMNLGHNGSLTTVHANSAVDALRRLESLVLMGGFDLPTRAIRSLLGSAFHVVIHMTRLPDGARRAATVSEVVADGEDATVQDLFRYEPDTGAGARERSGRHVATGVRPTFLNRIRAYWPQAEEVFPAANLPPGLPVPKRQIGSALEAAREGRATGPDGNQAS
jgi:pilus assembly protein CpaF